MLRHSTVYKLANQGEDTRALSHYLGHRNLQSTARYAPCPSEWRVSPQVLRCGRSPGTLVPSADTLLPYYSPGCLKSIPELTLHAYEDRAPSVTPFRSHSALRTLRERKGVYQRHLAFASLQLMTSLAKGRTKANEDPPAAVP